MKKVSQSLSNHIKQGDTVKVISGKDKGKVGEQFTSITAKGPRTIVVSLKSVTNASEH